MKQLLLISMIAFSTSLCMADKESRIREGYVSFPDGVTETSEMKRLGIEKHKIRQITYYQKPNYSPNAIPIPMQATEFSCEHRGRGWLSWLPKGVRCERCGTKGSYRLGYIYCADKKHYCEICLRGFLVMSAWENEYLKCENFLTKCNETAESNENIKLVRRYQQECKDAYHATKKWFKSGKSWW